MKPRWKRPLAAIAIFVALAGAGGFAIAWAGLVSVAASSGHWPVTAGFLHWTMRNAVDTQSLGTTAPEGIDLDDPALVLRGAGHFASGCAPCHGAPGVSRSAIAMEMVPEPPELAPRIPEWEDRELHWIVKNGIKFSAMPAWPALARSDEIWSMVAFIRQLPGMSEAEYARLAGISTGEAGARIRELQEPLGPILETSCSRCHGEDGLGRGLGAFPRLAGQSEAYLYASLRAYAAGERHSGFMQPVAAALGDETMRELAAHFASLPRGEALEAPATVDPALGEQIARFGVPEAGVPACVQCHGPSATTRAAIYPALAGQYPGYLVQQLEAFSQGIRGGTPFSHIMQTVAERMTSEQMKAVAAYYGSTKATSVGLGQAGVGTKAE